MRVQKRLAGIAFLLGVLAALAGGGGGGFEIDVPSQDVVLVQGQSTYVELELDRQGGFAGTVDLSLEGLPQGVEGTWEPEAVVNGNSTLHLRADANAPVGTYALSITARSGRIQQDANLRLHVDPRPDFQVVLAPPELVLEQGQHAAISVNVERQGEFTEEVILELEKLPDALSAELEMIPEQDDAATLYLDAERDSPAGNYTVLLVGRSHDRERSAELSVAVEAVPGFDLTADPASVQLAREESQDITVLVERWAEFAAPVHLEVVMGLPGGVAATFEPNPVDYSTSVLTLAASETASLGTYNLTVRGTANELIEEIPIDIVVVGRHPSDPEAGDS